MINIAILGFGKIGSGTYEFLATNKNIIEKKTGEEINVKYILDIRDFSGTEYAPLVAPDIDTIVNDPEVSVVAEMMGGSHPAYYFTKACLEAGKNVVTSNKEVVSTFGVELCRLARKNGVRYLFEASVGGGIPIIRPLYKCLAGNEIQQISGILNGTTNFMLDSMQSEGMDYAEALSIAQKLGYAEADPTADVSGMDALRKIMLACAVAYDKLPVDGFSREGIESITAADVKDFKAMGLTARLVTSGGEIEGKLYAYVEPVLFGAGAAECSVLKNFNMAKYMGKNSGSIVYIGQGAGRYPTASALIRDLYCIGGAPMFTDRVHEVSADNSAAVHSYYVRCEAKDAESFDFVEQRPEGGNVRGIIKPCAVTQMHEKAAAIREKGGKIFFAAMEK